MKSPDDLAARRARIQRLAAKRPPTLTIELTHAPEPGALEQLADVLTELLAARGRSGTR